MLDLPDPAVRVAAVTGESVEQVEERLSTDELSRVPKKMSPTITDLLQAPIESAVLDAKTGLPKVTLANGRSFFGLPSKPNHLKQYAAVSALLPAKFQAECFLAALDVVHRYCADKTVPLDLLPRKGEAIVEVGAFLGHKALRMLDASAFCSKLIALEIEPSNHRILGQNFLENGVANAHAIWCGAWNRSTTTNLLGKGRQRNTVVNIDGGRLSQDMETEVPLDRLDSILPPLLDGCKIGFLYLSVNGAEVEALEGLRELSVEVSAIRVAHPYQVDGTLVGEGVKRELLNQGFELDDRSRSSHSIGVRA